MTLGEMLSAVLNGARESTAVAGSAGGLVRWLSVRPRQWSELLVSVIVGGLVAVYATPAIAPFIAEVFGWTPVEGGALAAFVTGMLGVSITGFVIDTFAVWKRLKNAPPKKDDET